jgi:hypothetical protein
MLDQAQDKNTLQFLRLNAMECMSIALKIYKKTGNETFFELAEQFGNRSKDLKSKIEKLFT